MRHCRQNAGQLVSWSAFFARLFSLAPYMQEFFERPVGERVGENAAALHRVTQSRVLVGTHRPFRRRRLAVQGDLAVTEDKGDRLSIAGDDQVGAILPARQRVQVPAQMRLEHLRAQHRTGGIGHGFSFRLGTKKPAGKRAEWWC